MLKMQNLVILWLACALIMILAATAGCAQKAPSTPAGPTTAAVTTAQSASVSLLALKISDQEKQALIDKTRAYQFEGGVYHADSYTVVELKKGAVIYGMLPGQTVWYADQATFEAGRGSYKALYQLLQIRPHPVYGYRTSVGKYEVLTDIYVTAGVCRANQEISVDGQTENLGAGGGYQYVVFDYKDSLKLLEEIKLNE
jgi:hypothetical protein